MVRPKAGRHHRLLSQPGLKARERDRCPEGVSPPGPVPPVTAEEISLTGRRRLDLAELQGDAYDRGSQLPFVPGPLQCGPAQIEQRGLTTGRPSRNDRGLPAAAPLQLQAKPELGRTHSFGKIGAQPGQQMAEREEQGLQYGRRALQLQRHLPPLGRRYRVERAVILPARPTVCPDAGRPEARLDLAPLPLRELADPPPAQRTKRLSQLLGDRQASQQERGEKSPSLPRRNDDRPWIGQLGRGIGHDFHVPDPNANAMHPGFFQRLLEHPAQHLLATQALPPASVDPSQLRADQHHAGTAL